MSIPDDPPSRELLEFGRRDLERRFDPELSLVRYQTELGAWAASALPAMMRRERCPMKMLLSLLIALVAVVGLACTNTSDESEQVTVSPTPRNAAQQVSLTSTVAAPSSAACPTLAACPTSTACPDSTACAADTPCPA